MFTNKKLAPAAIFSMTEEDVIQLEKKSKKKEILITATIIVSSIAASIALAAGIEAADKKLEAHYTNRAQNPSTEN